LGPWPHNLSQNGLKPTQLTLWHPAAFGDFHKKNTETHVAFRTNFSGPVSATNPVKSSKGAVSLADYTQKTFFAWGYAFFVSDVISGGLLGHLGQLHLALGSNR